MRSSNGYIHGISRREKNISHLNGLTGGQNEANGTPKPAGVGVKKGNVITTVEAGITQPKKKREGNAQIGPVLTL